MDGLDFNEALKYLLDAVSTSHWAEVILLIVVLLVLVGGVFLIYKRMGSTERVMMRLFDMLAPPRSKAPPSKTEDKDGDKPG